LKSALIFVHVKWFAPFDVNATPKPIGKVLNGQFIKILVLREKSVAMETYFMMGLFFLAFVMIFIAYYSLHALLQRV
jgi:hypothetical protein